MVTEDNSFGYEIKNRIQALGVVPKRLLAAYIDLIIITFIGVLISIVQDFSNLEATFDVPIYSLFMLSLFKDVVYKEGSPGKKLLKLQIIPEERSDIVHYLKRIIRNSTFIIWPIEVIVLIIFKKRIGDMICVTDVLKQNK